MRHLTIEVIEEMLKGRISTNPNRFEEANGIVFSVNETTQEVLEYFESRGIELYELVKDIFYTETIMTVSEFENLKYVMHVKHIA
ncbi:hypothetical protein M2277_005072 [Paenibacillus sp. LBL]|uniref:hypothetical protein n=1 Tax=Paenibacillus sp. LBL TaxID=2940563 RepID=UPI002473C19C|nr:hypothetical protein [Paenibacillus sp. LBL]MDH6674380.1 hypothetical protein [Paenibacillus sp. LBL]